MTQEKFFIEQILKQIKDDFDPPSIVILGRTGAGKSRVIERVFGKELGISGAGKPQTKYYNKYWYPDEKPDIIIYDSPGYEADKTSDYLVDTINFLTGNITPKLQQDDQGDRKINLVWYAIHAALSRFESFDEIVINKARSLGYPVIIIITQCDIARRENINEIRKVIIEKVPEVSAVLEIAADPIDNTAPKGLEKLVNTSIDILPESYVNAFILAQKVNIKSKRPVAWTYIAGTAAICFTTAYVPIPGSTLTATLAVTIPLVKAISNLYDASQYIFPLLQTITINTQGGTIIIAALLDGLSTIFLPIFPPAFFIGESIAGSLAATYIVILGLTTIFVLEDLYEKMLESDISQREVEKFIQDKFKEIFTKLANIRIKTSSDLAQIENDFIKGDLNNSNDFRKND